MKKHPTECHDAQDICMIIQKLQFLSVLLKSADGFLNEKLLSCVSL